MVPLLSAEEIRRIEEQVNVEILANSEVSKEVMPIEAARSKGALALFRKNTAKKCGWSQWVETTP